jgi:tRNA(Ile)-lysidine synthase
LTLVARVGQFLEDAGAGTSPLVVAVSGGSDSVALLRAALAWSARPASGGASLGDPRVVIAHFNHQLRGSESDADETFVCDLHARLSRVGGKELLLRCGRAAVGDEAKRLGCNLESLARKMRYDWLLQVARETGARFIATGHTADDQAETVLFRLLRGAGLGGLRGIAARRALAAGVEILRPMLTITRQELLAYLDRERQDYRTDASNAVLDRTRNRIRHELLPHLAAAYNPAIASVLCHLAEQADDTFRDEVARALALLAAAELPRAGPTLVLHAGRLSLEPRHVVREVFRQVWQREGWPLGEMGFAEWDRLAALAHQEIVATDLPGRIRARRRGKVVQLSRVS